MNLLAQVNFIEIRKKIKFSFLELAHDTIIETIDIMQKPCVHKNNNPSKFNHVENHFKANF